ncbi:MAG: ECF transporter S component [Eubacteriales bacterium]|nr:ECF transporter S component [Eubacteriales bacterium]
MDRTKIRKLTFAAMFLALGIILPYFTGQIQEIGQRLLPMHIPVLLCGFVCGWPYGLIVGFITPLLRSLVAGGMPPLYPTAFAMAFELAAYGAMTGIFYKILPKKPTFIYVTLIISMLGGRIVWGIVQAILVGLGGSAFAWSAFVAAAFVNALPGIIIQLILIPVLLIALRDAKLFGKND